MSRILSGAALLVVVLAGCGGTASEDSAARGVPRALAREWEARASAIATAAAARDSCRAQQLAVALRKDVVASRRSVPPRLRQALLSGVYELADRTVCTRVMTVPAQPNPPGPGKGPKPPKHHGPHGHGKHGDGNDQ